MRVTNSQIFDRITTQLNNQQARLANTQEKIASGRNFLKPSDAPDQVAALDRLESRLNQTQRYMDNIGFAKDKLGQQEMVINTLYDDLSRVQELLVQGANGTMDANTRNAIAIEVREIYASLLALGNQKANDGSYLFSGYVQNKPPFYMDGNDQIQYQGNDEIQVIGIDDDFAIEVGMPGMQLFGGFKDALGSNSDIFAVLETALERLESNDAAGVQASIDDVEQALTHANVRLARVGSLMRTAENQLGVHEARVFAFEKAISQVEDLDYVTAVNELKQQTLALQAGQSSFAQISNLSLFNYIR